MEERKLSVVDITRCDDCDGMYNPCNHHLAKIHELGVDQWKVTGEITKDDVPRDRRKYTITDHAQHRMGSRHLNKGIAHHVIENGRVERAPGENVFRFVGRTQDRDGNNGKCVVVVSIKKENLEAGTSHPIVTIYMEDEDV